MTAAEAGLTLGVDASFLRPARVGGAEIFLRNLLHGLANVSGGVRLIVYGPRPPWANEVCRDLVTWVESKNSTNRFIDIARYAPRVFADCDATIYSNYFLPPRWPGRSIVIIYDAQYRHYPANFSRLKRLWLTATHAHAFARADALVTLSTFSRDDLLHFHGSRRTVTVIPTPIRPLGGGPGSLPQDVIDAASGPDPLILSVAAQYPHKNLATLITAFSRLRRHPQWQNVRLALVGQQRSALVGMRGESGIPTNLTHGNGFREGGIILTGFIDEEAKWWLLRRATAFAFPSLFEGFGMPPLEALIAGLPVVTTGATSIPEVTHGLANYVRDPLDPDELVEILARVLRKPRGISEKQRVWLANRYAPIAVARQYVALARRLR